VKVCSSRRGLSYLEAQTSHCQTHKGFRACLGCLPRWPISPSRICRGPRRGLINTVWAAPPVAACRPIAAVVSSDATVSTSCHHRLVQFRKRFVFKYALQLRSPLVKFSTLGMNRTSVADPSVQIQYIVSQRNVRYANSCPYSSILFM
jgi:hypothetical protein